jgi:VWFA-related protein
VSNRTVVESHVMDSRRIAAALALVPLLLAARQEQKQPGIHASTFLVQVNVIVDDKNGHPVVDLTKDDFVISDRGKVQELGIFSVDLANTVSQPHQLLPQNTFSDEPKYHGDSPNGVTIILLDNLNTLSGSSPLPYENTPYWLEDHALAMAKRRLIEFLKQLDSKNSIAIYGLTDTVHVLCDFTCDRAQLLAVVSRYDATSKTRREAVEPGDYHFPEPDNERLFDALVNAEVQRLAALNNQARGQATMAALIAIADHVADIPGRKNLLWLTANLPFSGQTIAPILGRANIAAYPVDARGLLPRGPMSSRNDVMDADAYALGELGIPPAQSPIPVGIDTMQEMADDTGGRAFVNTNDLTGAMRKVVEDSVVTYTLGFYLAPSLLDGKFHELKVQVGRSGLNLRYPKGYFALKDTPATQDERHNRFLAAIRSPLYSSAIPLQVKVGRVDQPEAHSLQILCSVGVKALKLVQDGDVRSGTVDVYVVEQDAAGNVLHQAANHLPLKLTEQEYQTYLQSGIVFREYVQLTQKAATLRVLVQDPGTSEVGSVIIPLSQVK